MTVKVTPVAPTSLRDARLLAEIGRTLPTLVVEPALLLRKHAARAASRNRQAAAPAAPSVNALRRGIAEMD